MFTSGIGGSRYRRGNSDYLFTFATTQTFDEGEVSGDDENP
jgi:hypothetical protein